MDWPRAGMIFHFLRVKRRFFPAAIPAIVRPNSILIDHSIWYSARINAIWGEFKP